MSVFYTAISNNKKVGQMQTTKISGSQNPADIKKKKKILESFQRCRF